MSDKIKEYINSKLMDLTIVYKVNPDCSLKREHIYIYEGNSDKQLDYPMNILGRPVTTYNSDIRFINNMPNDSVVWYDPIKERIFESSSYVVGIILCTRCYKLIKTNITMEEISAAGEYMQEAGIKYNGFNISLVSKLITRQYIESESLYNKEKMDAFDELLFEMITKELGIGPLL